MERFRKMQKRHFDREQYFGELVQTSERYFVPFIEQHTGCVSGKKILEIGCGEGGNMRPFADRGCDITGVDINAQRISEAKDFFAAEIGEGSVRFFAQSVFEFDCAERYDLIFVHDVIEHIPDKQELMRFMKGLLSENGVIFMAFPAWQMPFGGHQQICSSKLLSYLPFFHLLPKSLYRSTLKSFGEPQDCIDELLSIKECRLTIERFEKHLSEFNYAIVCKKLYFINPHYEIKFGLRPRVLMPFIAHIPYIRGFFSTSCVYILK